MDNYDEMEMSDMKEFLMNNGENTPKTTQMTKEIQEKVLEAIRNSNFNEDSNPPINEETKIVKNTEWCTHCDVTSEYETKDYEMTVICKNCGKTIILCDKCDHKDDGINCDKCIYCDLANFYNYLRGNNTIEQFMSAMNPPLIDMSSVADELKDKVLTYDDFIYDTYGDKVEWDVKYWEIYGLIKNSMLTPDSNQNEVISFLTDIINRNNN